MAKAMRVDTPEGWAVLSERGVPIANMTAFLRHLFSVERSPNTIRSYAYDLARLQSFLEHEDRAWEATNNEVLGSFVGHLRDPFRSGSGRKLQLSKATVNRVLSAVSSYALYLADATGDEVYPRLMLTAKRSRSIWQEQPREVVRVGPRLRAERPHRKTLSEEEVQTIIGSCVRTRDRLLFTLLNETGMRIGQALLLRHSDIRVPDALIRVERHDESGLPSRNKSSNSALVPVPPQLIRLYALYMHTEYGAVDSDFVFVNLWGGKIGQPMSYKTVEKLVDRLRARTGIAWWSAHSFRHTYVTRLLSAGVSMKTVSYLVTHASIATTVNIYNHLNVEHVRAELAESGIWKR